MWKINLLNKQQLERHIKKNFRISSLITGFTIPARTSATKKRKKILCYKAKFFYIST